MNESSMPTDLIDSWNSVLRLQCSAALQHALIIRQDTQLEVVSASSWPLPAQTELWLRELQTHLARAPSARSALRINKLNCLVYPLFLPRGEAYGALLLVLNGETADKQQLQQFDNLAARIGFDLYQHQLPRDNQPRLRTHQPGTACLPSLQAFIDSLNDHIWIKDLDGTYIAANQSVVDAWGGNPVGQSDADMFDRVRTELFETADREAIDAGQQVVSEECADALDPEQKNWLETVKSPVYDDAGLLIGVLGMTRNVTQRKLVEEQLALAATVFANSVEGVLITDKQGTIIEINNSFSEITGYRREEAIGYNPRVLKSGRHEHTFYAAMWQALLQEGRWQGEIWNRRKDGSIYPQQSTISSVLDDQGAIRYFVSVFSDVSLQKQSEERLAHMAYHDPLTDLPNRTQLKSQLEQELRHAARHRSGLAVVFLDVDHFKHINDSTGHLIGDEVLCEISSRLAGLVRQEDMVARIGGDEFVVVLNGITGFDTAKLVVNKLMGIFSAPIQVSTGDQLRLTGSMGVALYPEDGRDSDTLLRNADAAMYRAKRDGRNNVAFYTESLTQHSIQHLQLQGALHWALEEQQFYLTYQPQIAIGSGKLVGFEALLRWQHPEWGLISPAEFIPVAERIGLIVEIGRWVLRQACIQGKAWLDQGHEFGRIAVNVSGYQLRKAGFVETVRSALEDTGFPASALELEVTEGFVMQNADEAIETLMQLRELGIELAIDDFGTGYSSLSYLKRLPLNKLKIDRSFVRDIPEDTDNKAIAEAIIAMGEALSLKVIAEGVETLAQAEYLDNSGCELAQGYLYGKPLKADEVGPLFE